MGGYFAGSRNTVSVVSVEPQYVETPQTKTVPPPAEGGETVPPPAPAATAKQDKAVPSAVSQDDRATEIPPVSSQPGAPKGGDGRIDINSASRSELMDLPGIGNVLSGRIVDYRTQNGAFSKIEDIRNVSGIGEKRYEAIKDMITVG